ncbi:unnamed protein product [Caenorhabditis brenneri]
MEASLTSMPVDILDTIFQDFNYQEILNLRLINREFNTYVTTFKPDFRLKYITVTAITSGFVISFGENREQWKSKNHLKSVMCVEGDGNMWGPLDTILGHQKSILDYFELKCSLEENERGYIKLLEKMKTVLPTLPRKLQVVKLSLEAKTQDQVLGVLPHLDSAHLRKIEFTDFVTHSLQETRPRNTMETDQITELEQWRMAKKFSAERMVFDARITDFDHFDDVRIDSDTFKMSELKEWKENLCRGTSRKTVSISCHQLIQDDELPDNYTVTEGPFNGEIYCYRIPNSPDAVLRISQYGKNGSARFELDRFRTELVELVQRLRFEW